MRWRHTPEERAMRGGPRVTPDFDAMISTVSWNSAGFFFTEFLIPYAGISLGGSGLSIGVMFSFIVLGAAISSLLVGYLADKMRKTTLILIGSVGRGTSYLVMYAGVLVGSIPIMSTGTLVLGLLVAFFWVPFDSLVSNKSNKDDRSYAFGKRHAAVGRGQLAGGAIGVTIFIITNELAPGIDALLFSPMLLYFACNVIGGWLFTRRVNEHMIYQIPTTAANGLTDPAVAQDGGRERRESGTDESPSATNPAPAGIPGGAGRPGAPAGGLALGLTLLLASYFLSAVNAMMAKPFLQIYLLQLVTDSPTLVLLAYAPAGVLTMLASPRFGKLADRMNPYTGIAVFSVLGALATVAILLTTNIAVFSVILVVDMVFGNASSLVLSNLFSRVSIKHRGKVIGAGSAANNLGGAVGPILGGLLVDSRGIATPFIASIFIETSLILPYILAIKRLKPHLAEQLSRPGG
ncbi:MAG: MFS transporter [Candidatus Lokiarchaeota archaeon]|nr:MFS transporter [Candidatus Lokiarchaeota archaeon]